MSDGYDGTTVFFCCVAVTQWVIHFISGGGMNDHAALFVDDNNICILIEDIQRDILRNNIHRFCFGNIQNDPHAFFCFACSLALDFTVDNHRAFFHQ